MPRSFRIFATMQEMLVFPLVPETTMVSLGLAAYFRKPSQSRRAAMPGLSFCRWPVRP